MSLKQPLLKSLVLFCFSNSTVQSLEVKMPSDILRQCKDQRNIEESFLGSITFSDLGLMGPVLPKTSWRCEVLPFKFWGEVLLFNFWVSVLHFPFPVEVFCHNFAWKHFINSET